MYYGHKVYTACYISGFLLKHWLFGKMMTNQPHASLVLPNILLTGSHSGEAAKAKAGASPGAGALSSDAVT